MSCSPFPIHRCSITTDEWNSVIEFLSRTGQESKAPFYDEFDSLSDVLGVSALIETLNNPRVGNATESTFLGPYFTEDAPDRSSHSVSSVYPGIQSVPPFFPPHIWQSRSGSRSRRRERASTCMSRDACSTLAESPFQAPPSRHGRRTAQVSRASKFDSSPFLQPDNGYVTCIFYFPSGLYDTQYAHRTAPECRGRLKTDEEGKYGYRAIVPVPYFIRHDVGSPILLLISAFRDGSNLQ